MKEINQNPLQAQELEKDRKRGGKNEDIEE